MSDRFPPYLAVRERDHGGRLRGRKSRSECEAERSRRVESGQSASWHSGEVPVAVITALTHHEYTPTGLERSRPMRPSTQALAPNLPPDTPRQMLRRMLMIRHF